MHTDRIHTLRGDYALLLSLLQDSSIPGHIGDHLTDALVDLAGLFSDTTHSTPPPAASSGPAADPITALGGVRAHIHAAILDAATRSELNAVAHVGRHLALAERDLTGRPCSALAASRDAAGAAEAIRR